MDNDHDMLVRLDTKFDQMILDIKDLKDGIALRMSSVESRVELLEKVNDSINPVAMHTTLSELVLKIRDWQTTYKAWLWGASVLGGVGGYLVSHLGDVIKFLTAK